MKLAATGVKRVRGAAGRARLLGRHWLLVVALGVLTCPLWAPAQQSGAGEPREADRTAQETKAGVDPHVPQPTPDISFEDEGADPEQVEGAKSPFGKPGLPKRKDAVPGCVVLSNGVKAAGRIYTTRARRLKIFNLKRKRYEYVPVPALKRIEAVIEWERIERASRFKEAGSPEKVYTGKTYPVRMLAWRLTLRNDHQILGHILGQPLYVEEKGEVRRFVLHKRHRGPDGRTLKDLVDIKEILFGEAAYRAALEERKAKAEKAGETPAGEGQGEGEGDGAPAPLRE